MATVRPTPRNLRVLVADDAVDVATWLSILLRHNGYEVRSASNGGEAMEIAAEFQPNVALLDLGMPGLDGCEVARRIRSEEWGRGAILIAATGWGEAEDQARTQDAGFNHHLVKPVPPEKLLALLAAIPSQEPGDKSAHAQA